MYDVHNELKFSNQIDTVKLPIPVTTVSMCKGKKSCEIHMAGITCLWDSVTSDSMIKNCTSVSFEKSLEKTNKSMILPPVYILLIMTLK